MSIAWNDEYRPQWTKYVRLINFESNLNKINLVAHPEGAQIIICHNNLLDLLD